MFGTLKASASLAASGLALLSAGAATASSPPDVTFECTVLMTHTERPMYTEAEMKRFDRSFETCFEDVSVSNGLEKPELEYVTVLDQTWTDGSARRRERERGRRELRGGNTVQMKGNCRRCDPDQLNGDRRNLKGEEEEDRRLRRLQFQAAFDDCMLTELQGGSGGGGDEEDSDSDDEDMEAFDFVDMQSTVTTTCAISVASTYQVGDVVADGTFEIVDEIVCEVELAGVSAPLLSENEMAHYDDCMITSYNDIYRAVLNAPLMVRNQIVEQDPNGNLEHGMRDLQQLLRGNGDGDGGRRQMQQRRLGSTNKVSSKTGRCRYCDPVLLSTRRLDDAAADADAQDMRRRLLVATFPGKFETCLQSVDTKRGATSTYPAFDGDAFAVADAECVDPIPPASTIQLRQAESTDLFKLQEQQKKDEFQLMYDEEERKLEEARKEHELHKKEFEFQLKVDEERHKVVSEAYFEEQRMRLRKTCVIPKSATATCDGLHYPAPTDLVAVTQADTLTAKFVVNQNFAYDPIKGQCRESRPGYNDVHFMAEFAVDEDDGEVEYDCKEENKKCGETKEYESKKCYWNSDPDVMRMVADVKIAVLLEDLGVGPPPSALGDDSEEEDDRRRKLSSSSDDEESACARAEGAGKYCVMEFMIDCNCEVTA